MEDNNSKLLTVSQAAAALSLTESTVRAWVLRRQIDYVKVGKRSVRVPEREVRRIVGDGLVPARGKR